MMNRLQTLLQTRPVLLHPGAAGMRGRYAWRLVVALVSRTG